VRGPSSLLLKYTAGEGRGNAARAKGPPPLRDYDPHIGEFRNERRHETDRGETGSLGPGPTRLLHVVLVTCMAPPKISKGLHALPGNGRRRAGSGRNIETSASADCLLLR
jgi:hypothetical protein